MSLLFIWSVSFVWLNQIDQMNQINPRVSLKARDEPRAIMNRSYVPAACGFAPIGAETAHTTRTTSVASPSQEAVRS
jgi:hypothetical protein